MRQPRPPHQRRLRRGAVALVAGALGLTGALAGISPATADAADGLTEQAAAALLPAARDAAGPALAGIWFAPKATSSDDGTGTTDGTGRLMVGLWDPTAAPALSALGATPVVRTEPRRDPVAAQHALAERTASGMPAGLADFGVDEVTQTLVTTVVGDADPTTLLAGLDPSAVRVVHTGALPRRQAALGGGDTINDGSRRCTVGFAAGDGRSDWLVTAGHCTRGSDTWYTGPQDERIGSGARTADGSVDVGAVPLADGWTAAPTVGGEPVRGSRVAPDGASVCLYGSTSGRTCGPITRRNVTVNFDGQMQSGLTSVATCAHEGDSGGPYVTGDGQAQGVHTGAGGSDGCTSYYTPVDAAMSALGLTLRTS